ncbi:hypothetical protein BURPS305_5764 [Burkholderia pseudomallei 305]|nr:hypothetical protein BURPS305_5764 [Burkholderia pseudomallei 305]
MRCVGDVFRTLAGRSALDTATRVIAGYRPRRAGAADGFLRWRVVDRVGDRVVERLFNRVFDLLPHMPGRADVWA